MKLYVIRHGQTLSNKMNVLNGQLIDEPLEPEGVIEVENAIENIPKGISKIYASNMLRTRQTAEILNKALNLDLTFHPELREIDFGNLSGQSTSDIKEKYGEDLWKSYINQSYDFTPYEGENFLNAKNRIEKIIAEIKANHTDDEEILVVAHGGILRLLSHIYANEHYEATKNAAIREFTI